MVAALSPWLVLAAVASLARGQETLNCTLLGATDGSPSSIRIQGQMALVKAGPNLVRLDLGDPLQPVRECGRTFARKIAGITLADDLACVVDEDARLHVIDLTVPGELPELGALDLPVAAGRPGSGLASGSALFLPAGEDGLRVIDIGNPASPLAIGWLDTAGEAIGLALDGNTLYLTDGYNGLRVIDVSSPATPQEIGFLDLAGFIQGVALSGQHLLVTDAEGMHVLDLSIPAQPQEVGEFMVTMVSLGGVLAIGETAVVSYSSMDSGYGLFFLDISTPTEPQYLSGYPGFTRGLATHGDLLYAAIDMNGIDILDLVDPAQPQVVGGYDGPRSSRDLVVRDGLAYACDLHQGLRIFDIDTPAAIELRGVAGDARGAHEVALLGDLACVSIGDSLLTMDVGDPAQPQLLGACAIDGGWGVAVEDSLAFCAGSTTLTVVDLRDPWLPQVVGTQDTLSLDWDVAVEGSLACVASSIYGLRVYDISDPSAPSQAARLDVPGWVQGVTLRDGLAYLAERHGIRIVDLGNPAQPVELGYLTLEGDHWDISLSGDLAFLGGGGGLDVVDIADPTSPQRVGGFETHAEAYGVAVVGCRASLLNHDGSLLVIQYEAGSAIETDPIQPALMLSHGCRPNPFNPLATITFTLPRPQAVRLEVFDVAGRRVARLLDGTRSVGAHAVSFDGSGLASGVYVYRLQTGDGEISGKMLLMK